ncbi:hypothetical protein AR457_41700 (plasmid) [Streptomyces agglomeratus]|uniref:hypothetical protein n=1 Tax=Streptomyces agglomeratus TaxID=285458 RepID=UPI0008549FDB|nr:hypothetical protein [Streptomyces agglomeratus]OEJ20794.1 hypothetical protein AR457_41700 [Streptomyces agglomeratus]
MAQSTFPHDLVQAQRDWERTYAALSRPRPHNNTALRRRLLALSSRVLWHPFWATSTPLGRPAGGRMELRHQARAQQRDEVTAP